MATTTPPAAPAPTPTPAPTPAPVPAPPATNWFDPSHILTYVSIIVTALLGSNVFPSTSEAVKIMTILATVLATLGYHANVALVKRAHYAAIGRAVSTLLIGVMMAALLTSQMACNSDVEIGLSGPAVGLAGCSSSNAELGSDAINCLEQEGKIISNGFSVAQITAGIVAAVAAVMTGNVAAIIAALAPFVSQYGGQFVGCVIDDIPTIGAGSGSGATPAAVAARIALPADVKAAILVSLVGTKRLVHTKR